MARAGGEKVDTDQWARLANKLADMARDLTAQDSVEKTLSRVASYAVDLVPGCDAAGVMIVRRGQVETLAASDNIVIVSDRLQGELGEGPCFDATRNRHDAYRIADLTTMSERWPRYTPRARELGIGSMMGFLLYTSEDRDLGALDLYSSRPDMFDREHEHIGWLLAAHAAVAMSNAQYIDNLKTALDTRRTISEAVGILMARYKLTAEESFARIVRSSQNRNTKVRDLAEQIVYTGDLPEGR